MKNTLRIGLATAAFTVSVLASTGSAFAWGCIAVAGDGTYGYSYNYDNESDASDKALNECAKRATTDQTCEITECTEGS